MITSKNEAITALYSKMEYFNLDPTGNIVKDLNYVSDTARELLGIVRDINSSNPDFDKIQKDIEDFEFYLRDPTGFQDQIDLEIERVREEKKAFQRA